MLSKLKTLLVITLGFMPLAMLAPAAVLAVDCSNPTTTQDQIQCGVNQAAGGTDQSNKDAPGKLSSTIQTILNILSAVAGIAAVAMLIVAGIRFAASAGNETAVKGAKSAIIYAVIGLVIVALAQVVVHFVISNVSSG